MSKINKEEYEILKGLDDKYKWIARDENSKKSTFPNQLWLYEYKPKKGPIDWLGGGGATKRFRYDNLFQFIKWEDEEPYNIAELIEEYEIKELRLAPSGTVIVDSFDESEETEVKDKIWLKDSITKEMQDLFSTTNPNYFDFEYTNKKIRGLVNQLDEPEVLSEEWVSDNAVVGQYPDGMGYVVPAYKLQNLLVPKQEQITEEQEEERPETVARVIFEYVKATQRFKEILGMKVEELEE